MPDEETLAHEQREITRIGDGIAQVEERWPEAVENAKQWEPGMLRSAWTMPLEILVQNRETLLKDAGVDPETITVPKKADAHEKALPEHVREAYRRGEHLHGALKAAHAAKQQDHAARKAAKAKEKQNGDQT